MPSINVTCAAPNPRQPCSGCRAASKILTAGGFRVLQTGRYEALRAAATGGYGFDACIVEVGRGERAIAAAIVSLLKHKRVLVVAEDPAMLPDLPSGFAVTSAKDYQQGKLPPEFPTAL